MNIQDSEYNDSVWLANNAHNNIPYFLTLTSVLQTESNECVSAFWTALHNLIGKETMAVKRKSSLQAILTLNTSIGKVDDKIDNAITEGDLITLQRLVKERKFLTSRIEEEYTKLKKYVRNLESRG